MTCKLIKKFSDGQAASNNLEPSALQIRVFFMLGQLFDKVPRRKQITLSDS